MQAHPLEFACGQLTRRRPDLIRHPDTAQIVDVSGAPSQCHGIGVKVDDRGRLGGKTSPACE
jgi:hypothetical protein